MPDHDEHAEAAEVTQRLDAALERLEQLSALVDSGEPVPEKELAIEARTVAEEMEEVRLALEQLVGPMDREELKARLREHLTAEEYAEWLETEPHMLEFRKQYAEERPLREAIGMEGEKE